MAGIDGNYLRNIRTNYGWSENEAAKILECQKTQIIKYEKANPGKPLETDHAERLIKKIACEEQAHTHETKDILEKMLHEMRGEPHSFSPNKILCHMDVVRQVLDETEQWNVWPFLVEIHLTNACSHACPGCTFREIQRNTALKSHQLCEDKIFALLDQLREGGTRAIFWSGGGDPLMYPAAMKVFDRAAKLGFRQILITNGSCLNPDYAPFLIKNFSCIRVSLDAQTHTTFARMHGIGPNEAFSEFNTIQNNIRKLVDQFNRSTKEDRHPDINEVGIGVSFLLHEANKDEIIGFCTLARDGLGVRFAEIKPIVHERNETNDAMVRKLVSEEVAASLRYVRQHVERKSPSVFRVFTLEQKFLDMLSESYGKNWDHCWGHPLYPAIAADGGVYPCCLMIGKADLCYGDVNEQSFADIWNSNARKEAVKQIVAPLCPINCKLSETNRALEIVHRANALPLRDYLN